MDKDRQIRFLYPPLIFLASIALGLCFDDSNAIASAIKQVLSSQNNVNVVVALVGAGSIILVIGFLITTLTIFILRIIFFKSGFSYEIKLSNRGYKGIAKVLFNNDTDQIDKRDRMYAGVTFDHSFLPPETHQWIVRRWNGFYISASSSMALILSLVTGILCHINWAWNWIIPVAILLCIFIIQSYFAWKETMGMIDFQTKIRNRVPKTPNAS